MVVETPSRIPNWRYGRICNSVTIRHQVIHCPPSGIFSRAGEPSQSVSCSYLVLRCFRWNRRLGFQFSLDWSEGFESWVATTPADDWDPPRLDLRNHCGLKRLNYRHWKNGFGQRTFQTFPGRQRLGIHPRMLPRPLPVLLTMTPGASEFQPFIRIFH